MGRPRLEREGRPSAVQTRLNKEDLALWHRVVDARLEELRADGVEANASDVLRWLIKKEAVARGFAKERPAKKSGSK